MADEKATYHERIRQQMIKANEAFFKAEGIQGVIVVTLKQEGEDVLGNTLAYAEPQVGIPLVLLTGLRQLQATIEAYQANSPKIVVPEGAGNARLD